MAPTRGPGHATELARKAVDDGYELVLACGGDGTVNEIATGLCGTSAAMGNRTPAGSGNGLARHLGIPVDIDSSLPRHKRNRTSSPPTMAQPTDAPSSAPSEWASTPP